MRIERITVQNFRSILDEKFSFDDLTVLVGPNGCGKSSLLRAIQTFYEPSPVLSTDDYYNKDESAPIKIAVTFTDLNAMEAQLFAPYIHSGSLTVTKVITPSGEKYHGARMQHPGFDSIRSTGNKTQQRAAYNKLRNDPPYNDLPAAGNAEQVDAGLSFWELQHPDQCQMAEDTGQFFGFRNVGQSRLERFTRFVFVPAVRDADQDAVDTRGSAIFQLMEMVVRSALAQNKRFTDFKANVQQQYADLISPANLTQLGGLSSLLTSSIRAYVPTASVMLEWLATEDLAVPLPKALVRLEEDGFSAPVDRVGHGLQRAFILSLLQVLVNAQLQQSSVPPPGQSPQSPQPDQTQETPSLILGIEEPELYQHPNRQRHLARVLARLSSGGIPGVAAKTQVIYCTHSPLFLDLERFGSVRRLTKVHHGDGLPRKTRVNVTSLEQIARRLSEAQDEPAKTAFSTESLRARMQAIMTPWVNEGFFADVAVLVEGEDDRAAILGAAVRRGIDLESKGVAVIPCGGKHSIDRPFLVFSGLGIPTYIVFDADTGKAGEDAKSSAKANRALQRLIGCGNVKDFPDTQVASNYAVFQTNLNAMVRDAVGEKIYESVALEFIERHGYPKTEQCRKSPAFICKVLEEADKANVRFVELEGIIDRVLAMVPPSATSTASVEPEAIAGPLA